MQALQTVLDFAALAPLVIASAMFLEYTWKRSAPQTVHAPAQVEETQVQPPATELHIPDPTAIAEAALAEELIEACLSTAVDKAAIAELLEIPASVPPVQIAESALIPLAKLYSIPGSSKWSYRRKLRANERQAVMEAIAS